MDRNVKNYIARPDIVNKNNIYNFSLGQWSIDGVPVTATADQLNGTAPVFGKFRVVENLSGFPEPDMSGGIHLEDNTWYLISEDIDLVSNYFVIDSGFSCKISACPGVSLSSDTTGAMLRSSGLMFLVLEEISLQCSTGTIFEITSGAGGSVFISETVFQDCESLGFINSTFSIIIEKIFVQGTPVTGLSLTNAIFVSIKEILDLATTLVGPVITLDGLVGAGGFTGNVATLGARSSYIYISPTCQILGSFLINDNPYAYLLGTFFDVGPHGSIGTITDNGGSILVTTTTDHGLTGTFLATLENTADYDNNFYQATVISANSFSVATPFTNVNNGGQWTAPAFSFIASFSDGGSGTTIVTTPEGHQKTGDFGVSILGNTQYAGTYTGTVTGSNTFTIPVPFGGDDVGPDVSWDATSQANENENIHISNNGELPDSPPTVKFAAVELNSDNLGNGPVTLVKSYSPRMSVNLEDFRATSSGPNFAGGDRDLRVIGSGVSYSDVDASSLQNISGARARWGDAEVPFGTFSQSKSDIVAEYTGGSADYTSGRVLLYISYVPEINKLGL